MKRFFRVIVPVLLMCIFITSSPRIQAKQETFRRWTDYPRSVNKPIVIPGGNHIQEVTTKSSTPPQESDTYCIDEEGQTQIVNSDIINGNLELIKRRNAKPDIYSNDVVRITHNNVDDYYPVFRRDALKVAFVREVDGNPDIYVMNSDSSNTVRLTYHKNNDTTPDWSYDEKYIIYASYRGGVYNILRMNADGTNLIELTDSSTNDFSPVFSPFGTQIAFLRQVSNTQARIMLMNPDGSNKHFVSPPILYIDDIRWSPRGDRFAFDYDGTGDGWLDIGMINIDGSGLTLLEAGKYKRDYWMGGWISEDKMVINRVYYKLVDGVFYISDGSLVQKTVGGYTEVYNNNGLMPRTNRLDYILPRSRLQSTPLYSRAGGFPVTITGTDQGGSPRICYQIQYRYSPTEPWNDWLITANSTNTFTGGNPGDTITFRGRAVDLVGNWEEWPDEVEWTSTTLYAETVAGKTLDNRGNVIPDILIDTAPTPLFASESNITGDYQLLTQTSDPHTLTPVNSAYGSPPATMRDLHELDRLDFYLRPKDNQIINGDFEDDPSTPVSWTTNGTLPMNIVTGHTGENGLHIKLECDQPCWSEIEQPYEGNLDSKPVIAIDSHDQVHLVFSSLDDTYYAYRDVSGTWSEPFSLGEIIEGLGPATFSQIFIDDKDTLHLIVSTTEGAYYLYKMQSGSWSAPELIDALFYLWSSDPYFAVDRNGVLHLIFDDDENLYYTTRKPDGTWETGEFISEYIHNYSLTLEPPGKLHLVYPFDYQRRSTDGEVLEKKDAAFGVRGNDIEVAPDQTVFVLDKYYIDYSYAIPEEEFHNEISLPGSATSADMEIDSKGAIFIVTVGDLDTGEGYYFYRAPSDETFNMLVLPFSKNGLQTISMEIDHHDLLHMVNADENTISYMHTFSATEPEFKSIEQTVTIPPDMHKPTLSFVYKLNTDYLLEQSGLYVDVISGGLSTTVFSTTVASDWQVVGVDMSAWAGETVDVRFTVQQAQDEPVFEIWLDEIALGSWLTPKIEAITPDQVFNWDGALVTIQGENFIDSPAVMIDDLMIEDPVFLDEFTLQFDIPSGLPAGLYDIWVINPDGQAVVAADGLSLGCTIRLPMIMMDYY